MDALRGNAIGFFTTKWKEREMVEHSAEIHCIGQNYPFVPIRRIGPTFLRKLISYLQAP